MYGGLQELTNTLQMIDTIGTKAHKFFSKSSRGRSQEVPEIFRNSGICFLRLLNLCKVHV